MATPLLPSGVLGVRVDRVRVPFRRPFQTSTGPWSARESWIVRVREADGEMWAGEAPIPRGADPLAGLDDPRLAGALADALEAMATGWTVPDVEVAVNATLEAAGLDDLLAEALASVAAGFRTLKLKVGSEGSSAVLRERVGAVRAAVGPAIRLRLDANGAWDEPTAVERLRAVAGLDLELVEQPIEPGDPRVLARVRRAAGVPIAADEGVASVADAERLVLAGAVDALVVKPSRVGGQRAAQRIGELALSAGVPVVLSTLFETGVGIARAVAAAGMLAAILPPGVPQLDHGLATAPLLEDDLVIAMPGIVRGRIRAFAAEPDGAAVERYRVGDPLVLGAWS